MTSIRIACGAALCAVSARAASSPLYDALSRLRFLHEGVVASSDDFTLLPVPCAYLEPENVTVAPAQGIGWTQGGACPLLWATNASAGACNAQPPESDHDRQGGDFRAFSLPATPNGTACQAACCSDEVCNAWAYTPTAPHGQAPCPQGTPCCYLKSTVSPSTPAPGVTSGVMERPPIARSPPPFGLRSSVPLGGVGAGAAELRGDGTFHEVTIVNQSPAGAAKYGVLADAWLGARVGGVARLLRTSPPQWGAGVSSLAYSGAYPVSRLTPSLGDFPLPVSLFAFSKLLPGNPVASSSPSIVFTLSASNPTDSLVNVSFIFAMPLAAVNDCARRTAKPIATLTTPAAAGCLHACRGAAPTCLSWTWDAQSGQCALAADVPLSVHAAGSYCGLASGWSSGTLGDLTLSSPCAASAPSPACGDSSVTPVLTEGVGVVSSAGVADDSASLWASFAATGGITPGSPNVSAAGSFYDTPAAVGASTISITVPPGTNASISLIWSWFFPHRDHAGEDIGNSYAGLWSSSADVAHDLAGGAGEGLVDAVNAIVAHHSVFSGGSSSLPDWLSDHLINHMSHFRGMIWSRDGRMREFEAFDCMDLDSIHNDYQRHLPYLWLMPEFEVGKLRKWASGQLPSGVIQEFLGQFGVSPFDVPGGRIMGDTTTLWIVELFELWRNTADDALLTELWPTAMAALNWTVANADEIGLPWKLYSTYDILWLDSYNTTTYNALLYMAALKAGAALADAVGDAATGALVAAALTRAENALDTLLWDESGGYYRAYSWGSDAAVMADSLYGQVIASGLGLGWLAPPARLASHLAAEVTHNANAFGFRSVTGRVTPPPNGEHPDDDSNWQQAAPDWSSLALALLPTGVSPAGSNVTAALEPVRRALDNWRDRVRSLWNIAGITSSDSNADEALQGMPYVTSHYGFQLVEYWLLPILVGQTVNLPAGSLSFMPLLPCPMQLPVLLAATTGTLSCDEGGAHYTLSIAFGTLTLPAGGLVAGGRAYADAVDLGAGDSVTW